MERKKTALSRFFDVIDGVENAVLAVMVVGMIFTILVHRACHRTSFSLDRGDQQVSLPVDDVRGTGGRL